MLNSGRVDSVRLDSDQENASQEKAAKEAAEKAKETKKTTIRTKASATRRKRPTLKKWTPTNRLRAKKEGEVVPLTPRPLHRTSSIFLRTISPRVTRAEIETICKKYPGFLRVSLSDPQPEQVKDGELGAIVNRDLSRRVRSVSALSAHKTVVLNDLKLAARIIQELDSRHKIWNQNESLESSFGLHSDNPILKDITEYLVEEASAEEEELLGQGVVPDDSKNKHAQAIKVIEKEVNDYCEQYKTKLDHLMRPPEQLSDSELASLGAKSEDVEVEKFIQANTQELAKDKWLCPLSGKKFKGAQFVKKHIFNKFSDQLDEVKKE
ncbi:unnamed protein product, partial [Nesidiocoris tenuis]